MKQDVFNVRLDGIEQLIKERFEHTITKIDAVHEQACRTNGRVDKLELKAEKLEEFQNRQKGALGLVKFMGFSNLILILALIIQHFKE